MPITIAAMSIPKTCELCGSDPRGTGFTRIAGFDVCDGCLYGDMKTRLAHLGIVVDGKVTETHRPDGAGYRSVDLPIVYQVDIDGRCPSMGVSFGLALGLENLVNKLLKIFTKEIQVGDSLFDDHIYIRSSGDEEAARAFLEHERVQSAIMELMGVGGDVSIVDGNISVSTVHEEHSAFERCQLAVACLLVCLTRSV